MERAGSRLLLERLLLRPARRRGFANTDITDPVQLAEGGAATGVTTTHLSPSGAVIGGQLGCDYQFAPNWVIGVEGAASGSTLKGSKTVGLPDGFAGDQALVSSKTDFLPSVTGRLGYAIDRTLFYGKAGVAWASDKYTVAGSFQGAAFDYEGFDTRTGWTAGASAVLVSLTASSKPDIIFSTRSSRSNALIDTPS
jgi:outer membrane immunogenic protein